MRPAFPHRGVSAAHRLPLALLGPGAVSLSEMLYSSTGEVMSASAESADANTYRPFKTLDATVMGSIAERLGAHEGAAEEGAPCSFPALVPVPDSSPRAQLPSGLWAA